MNKDSELIIEVADEYESLKSFESGNQQMDDFDEKNHFAKLTPVPQFDVWPMYKTLWY